jgi:hypothetical protein
MSIQSLVVGALLALCSAGALAQEAAPPPATVTGSGTANYIPMWTSSSVIGNSKLYQTGGKIGVGTTTPSVALDVNGRVNVSKAYRILGLDVLVTPGTTTTSNNVGVGFQALSSNSTGLDNTAVGQSALHVITSGSNDTGIGFGALESDTAGYNTAVGAFAMLSNTMGVSNTASGEFALEANTIGNYNTALGQFALPANTTGSSNIAIGHQAAQSVSAGNSNNIHIGSSGASADNGAIRIGTIGTQTTFFAAGISGVTTGVNDAVPVVVDSNGQLGTVSSSRRFKEDIEDMGKVSEGLMRLRPVTFRYQKPFADGSKPLQYGLVAEEVAEVYPDLVTHSADGQIQTVKYQVLDSMLLNEVQKQQGLIRQQQMEIDGLKEKLDKVEASLAAISRAK